MWCLLLIQVEARSATDCFPFPDVVWNSTGSIIQRDSTTYLLGSHSAITYSSGRNRKKWQLKICCAFINSTLSFTKADNSLFTLQFTSTRQNVLNISTIHQELPAHAIFEYPTSTFCVNLLYGRESFVLLQRPDGNSPAKNLLNLDTILPRNTTFSLVSDEAAELTELCMGDFIGDSRHSFTDSDSWDMKVHDFL